MKGNFKILFTSILACLTIPGLAETYSVYLGDYGVKAFALLLLFLNLKEIGELFKHPKIKSVLVVLLLLFIYRSFNITTAVQQPLLPLISLIWLVIIYLSIKTEKHLEIFIFCLYLSSCIVLLSPGLERILDFTRFSYSENRSENALIGIANHYILYAQMAIISFYLSLFYLLKFKSIGLKFLALLILIISIVAIITSGSRGAILAILISLGFLIFMYKKYLLNNKFKFGVFLLITSSILFSFIPLDNILSSFKVMGTVNDASSIHRLYLYYFSLESFYNAPFFGNGWDYVRLKNGLPPHTIPIQLLAELGFLGLILEFLVYNKLFSLFKLSKSQLTVNDINIQHKMNILFSMLIAIGSWSLFENLGFVLGTRWLYIVAALIMCYYKIINLNKLNV